MNELESLIADLILNARTPRNELDGWDHKREYRRLRDLARAAKKALEKTNHRSETK